MAVYKRNYKPYAGRLTPQWPRFLVISKFALESLFQSRLVIAFMVACFIFPVFCGAAIYLHHNLTALTALSISPENLIPINSEFFAIFMSIQGAAAFMLTAYA